MITETVAAYGGVPVMYATYVHQGDNVTIVIQALVTIGPIVAGVQTYTWSVNVPSAVLGRTSVTIPRLTGTDQQRRAHSCQ